MTTFAEREAIFGSYSVWGSGGAGASGGAALQLRHLHAGDKGVESSLAGARIFIEEGE